MNLRNKINELHLKAEDLLDKGYSKMAYVLELLSDADALVDEGDYDRARQLIIRAEDIINSVSR